MTQLLDEEGSLAGEEEEGREEEHQAVVRGGFGWGA